VQWFRAGSSESHLVIGLVEYNKLNALSIYPFQDSEQVSFRLNANHDQMDCLVWFSKLKACRETSMTYLNDLISN
jgi:hypothetical protein